MSWTKWAIYTYLVNIVSWMINDHLSNGIAMCYMCSISVSAPPMFKSNAETLYLFLYFNNAQWLLYCRLKHSPLKVVNVIFLFLPHPTLPSIKISIFSGGMISILNRLIIMDGSGSWNWNTSRDFLIYISLWFFQSLRTRGEGYKNIR